MPSLVHPAEGGGLLVGLAAQRQAESRGETAWRPDGVGGDNAGQALTPATAWTALIVASADAARPAGAHSGPQELVVLHPARWAPDQLSALGRALTTAGLPAPRFVTRPVCIAALTGAQREPGTALAVITDDGEDFEIAVLEHRRQGLRALGPSGGLSFRADRPEQVTATELGDELLATLAAAELPVGRLQVVVLAVPAAVVPHLRETVQRSTGIPVQVLTGAPGEPVGAALAAGLLGLAESNANPDRTPVGRRRRALIAVGVTAAVLLGCLGAYALVPSPHTVAAAGPRTSATATGSAPIGKSGAGPITPSARAAGPYDVYVADQETDSITPVNTTVGLAGPPIQLGSCQAPGDLVVTPDRKQAFAECVGGMIRPVNLTTGSVGAPITLSMQGNNDLVLSPDGSRLYALSKDTSSDTGEVTAIDTRTDLPGHPIPVIGNLVHMVLTPDGRHLFVLDYGSGGGQTGSVTDLDTVRGTASAPITLGENPGAIVFTPDGRTAFIACSDSRFVLPLSTATDTVGQPIPVDSTPTSLAITPDGRTVYAFGANAHTPSGSSVTPIDAATRTVGAPIDMEGNSMSMAPSGRQVFVYDSANQDTVNWFDTATGQVQKPITVGTYPSGLAFSADSRMVFILRDGGGTVDPVTTVVPVQLPSGLAGKPITVMPGAGVIAAAAARPVVSGPGTGAPSSPSSTASAPTGGAGAVCGPVGASPSGGTLVLVIRSGSLSCAEALKVLNDYRTSPDRQGSGGFATVDGWNCAHGSVADFEQTGELEGCQRGAESFGTKAA
jgi:YVTN family beta-propeller protein